MEVRNRNGEDWACMSMHEGALALQVKNELVRQSSWILDSFAADLSLQIRTPSHGVDDGPHAAVPDDCELSPLCFASSMGAAPGRQLPSGKLELLASVNWPRIRERAAAAAAAAEARQISQAHYLASAASWLDAALFLCGSSEEEKGQLAALAREHPAACLTEPRCSIRLKNVKARTPLHAAVSSPMSASLVPLLMGPVMEHIRALPLGTPRSSGYKQAGPIAQACALVLEAACGSEDGGRVVLEPLLAAVPVLVTESRASALLWHTAAASQSPFAPAIVRWVGDRLPPALRWGAIEGITALQHGIECGAPLAIVRALFEACPGAAAAPRSEPRTSRRQTDEEGPAAWATAAIVDVERMQNGANALRYPLHCLLAEWSYLVEGARRHITSSHVSGGAAAAATAEDELAPELAAEEAAFCARLVADMVAAFPAGLTALPSRSNPPCIGFPGEQPFSPIASFRLPDAARMELSGMFLAAAKMRPAVDTVSGTAAAPVSESTTLNSMADIAAARAAAAAAAGTLLPELEDPLRVAGSNAFHAAAMGRVAPPVMQALLDAAQHAFASGSPGAPDPQLLLRQVNEHGCPPLVAAALHAAPLETIRLLLDAAPDVARRAWPGFGGGITALQAALLPVPERPGRRGIPWRLCSIIYNCDFAGTRSRWDAAALLLDACGPELASSAGAYGEKPFRTALWAGCRRSTHFRGCPGPDSCSYDASQEARVLHALLDADPDAAANGAQLEGEENQRTGTFGLGFHYGYSLAGDDDAAGLPGGSSEASTLRMACDVKAPLSVVLRILQARPAFAADARAAYVRRETSLLLHYLAGKEPSWAYHGLSPFDGAAMGPLAAAAGGSDGDDADPHAAVLAHAVDLTLAFLHSHPTAAEAAAEVLPGLLHFGQRIVPGGPQALAARLLMDISSQLDGGRALLTAVKSDYARTSPEVPLAAALRVNVEQCSKAGDDDPPHGALLELARLHLAAQLRAATGPASTLPKLVQLMHARPGLEASNGTAAGTAGGETAAAAAFAGLMQGDSAVQFTHAIAAVGWRRRRAAVYARMLRLGSHGGCTAEEPHSK